MGVINTLTTQDIITIALILMTALFALEFPGGPGTPRRIKIPIRSWQ